MPRVHRVASLLKRWLLGTHQGGVQQHHADAYLDEFVFRFNRRTSRDRASSSTASSSSPASTSRPPTARSSTTRTLNQSELPTPLKTGNPRRQANELERPLESWKL